MKGTPELGSGEEARREQSVRKGHGLEYFPLQKVVVRTCYTFSRVTEHLCTWHTVRPWGYKDHSSRGTAIWRRRVTEGRDFEGSQ